MTSLVALIPARAGSKRIPGKAIKQLGQHPLIAYTIAAARQAGIFDHVLVCSDSDEVLAIAKQHRAEIYRRHFSHDTEPDIQWVSRVLYDCGQKWDVFSILRPTSPFRIGETIRQAWQEFRAPALLCGEHWDVYDSLRAVEPARQHACKQWTMHGRELVPLLLQPTGTPWHSMPTQLLPKVYVQTAGLEIAWTETVRKTGTIAGDRILAFEMSWPESLDINTPEDWLMAELLVERGLAKLPDVTANIR